MDKNLRFGIIGLGLIGASIFKALCTLKCSVIGVSKSPETIEKAKEYTPFVYKSLEPLKDCDIVFVCTPMDRTLKVLDELESVLRADAIVMDVCSLKSFLCNKKRPYNFIPSHPMAGTENSGFDSSFATLFQGSKWVFTPIEPISEKDHKTVSGIAQVLGANPVFMNPQDHDEAVALISHMPLLLSQALFATAESNKAALKIASSGFRDMTRLAMSNIDMAEDMMKLNADNVQQSLLKLYSNIGNLLSDDYRRKAYRIKESRVSMYRDGVNIL